MHHTPSTRPFVRVLFATVAVAGLVLAGCGSSDSDSSSDASTTAATGADTTALVNDPLPSITILVSNDDGYEAEGIDALVSGLESMEGVDVVVYAPLEQQSGTGGEETDGELAVTDVKLANGTAAKAVDGFPADTIRVAMDDDGVEPDLVVTGINLGQNLGPVVDYSGTVGAARAAVARGVPALATSSGLEGVDVDAAVPYIVEWITKHREAIAAEEQPVEVWNMNFPSCDTGEIRGLLEVDSGVDEPIADALTTEQDCESSTPESELTDDVLAFNQGFATLTKIPDEPAA